MSPIENRLEASLKMDALNGDSFERSIVAKQIKEAISEIRQLRLIRDNLLKQVPVEQEGL